MLPRDRGKYLDSFYRDRGALMIQQCNAPQTCKSLFLTMSIYHKCALRVCVKPKEKKTCRHEWK